MDSCTGQDLPMLATGTLEVVDLGLWKAPGPAPVGAVRKIGPKDLPPELRGVAGFGGAVLGLAVMDSLGSQAANAFCLCVGYGVAGGQATASRASVIARSPMTGRLTQGQVGSDLARRLAQSGHGVLLLGKAPWPDAVLVLQPTSAPTNAPTNAPTGAPVWHLESIGGLESQGTSERAQRVQRRFGVGAVLRPGPAAHAGVLFANLSAGSDPPSFVGRGGLGFAFAALGLAALLIRTEPIPEREGESSWVDSLLRSPRLLARAQGQRLEEAQSLPDTPSLGKTRHGCKGCPTPCGFVFESPQGGQGNARFSAFEPLMRLLTGADGTKTGELLEACNALGVDAMEAGGGLHAVLEGMPAPERAKRTMVEWLYDLCLGKIGPPAFREGTSALLKSMGRDVSGRVAQGVGVRPAQDLATRLAHQQAARGAEPLRSFGFLVGDHADLERMRRLVAPMHLPDGSSDPDAWQGKGRLLWWHENLVAGVDTLGICAFSVAGLLSDGVLGMEALAGLIMPSSLVVQGASSRTGALLSIGAHANELFARFEQGMDQPVLDKQTLVAANQTDSPSENPSESQPDGSEVEQAFQWAVREYKSLRVSNISDFGTARLGGIPKSMRATRPKAASEGGPMDVSVVLASERSHRRTGFAAGGPTPEDSASGGLGVRILIRPQGALLRRLDSDIELRFDSHPTSLEALEALALRFPRAAEWLIADGRPIPAVILGDRVLGTDERLDGGAVLFLHLAISGG